MLETANVIAGPTAGKLLGVLGAEVIKMEPPDGDISRPTTLGYFYILNSNKRSVSVNARTDEGREVAKRMADQADILVANMRPGATDRIGIGTEALGELNPTIIQAHVTAFGWTGPYSHRPGLDPLAQALIGLQRAQGGPENPPVFLGGIAPNDYVSGAMGALAPIIAPYALVRTGLGLGTPVGWVEVDGISDIVAGLIASWIDRQGLVVTVSSALTASILTRLTGLLLLGA